MAQKTPVPALTIALSGTWTSLWYYDFTEVQQSWSSNLQLHYLAGAYFALKRRLIHNFSVVQNNHLIYVNGNVVNLITTKKEPFRKQNFFLRAPKLLAKAKRRFLSPGVISPQLRTLSVIKSTPFRKSFKKKLRSKSRFSNKLTRKNYARWILNQYRSKNPSVKKTLVRTKFSFNSLKKSYWFNNAQPIKPIVFFESKQTPVYLQFTKNSIRCKRSPVSRRRRNGGKRFFTTSSIEAAPFLPTIQSISSIKTHSSRINKVYYLAGSKLEGGVYGNTNAAVLSRALYRRWVKDRRSFFRLRLVRRKKGKYRKVSLERKLKIIHSNRFKTHGKKHRYIRRFTKLSLLRLACQHVTGFKVRLNIRRYNFFTNSVKNLKFRAVFARWSRRDYFLPTVSIVLLALMRGSAALLVNYLHRLLKVAKTHSSILYLVSFALKYFLQESDQVDRVLASSPCAGARLEVIGKIDGQDRAKTFRVQVGAIPTSTLSAPLDCEYAVCGTRYGVLAINVWFLMKPLAIKSSNLMPPADSLYFGKYFGH